MEDIIQIKEEIACDISTTFDYFTKNAQLETWLTVKADVSPKFGGKYELFWEPENREDNSTIGCKITGIENNVFISFDWKGPVQFKSFMNTVDPLTHVLVFFTPNFTDPNVTTIHLFHTGWRSDPKWKEARDFFEKAWLNALKVLKKTAMKK
ncbi:MAG: SRPBCC family protein [Promethearchaeota archaeon]|jgi:uncharacterized protein YndB with AHSA1/START domain